MGSLLSRFRKKPTTEEQLKKIEEGLRKIEDYKRTTEKKHKRLVANIIIYSAALYILACFIVFVWYLPESWMIRLGLLVPLVLVPVIIYLLKRLISRVFDSRMVRANEQYADLQRKKRDIIDSVMETETFNKAKEILSKYAPEKLHKKEPPQISRPLGLPANALPSTTDLRKRNTGATTPAPTRSEPITSLALVPRRELSPTISGMMPKQRLPQPVFPQERGVTDKLIEFMIGDGPGYRYALICSYCRGHNGMALKEEFPYMAFNCCYCYQHNPARSKRPVPPKLPVTMNLPAIGSPPALCAPGSISEHSLSDTSLDEEPVQEPSRLPEQPLSDTSLNEEPMPGPSRLSEQPLSDTSLNEEPGPGPSRLSEHPLPGASFQKEPGQASSSLSEKSSELSLNDDLVRAPSSISAQSSDSSLSNVVPVQVPSWLPRKPVPMINYYVTPLQPIAAQGHHLGWSTSSSDESLNHGMIPLVHKRSSQDSGISVRMHYCPYIEHEAIIPVPARKSTSAEDEIRREFLLSLKYPVTEMRSCEKLNHLYDSETLTETTSDDESLPGCSESEPEILDRAIPGPSEQEEQRQEVQDEKSNADSGNDAIEEEKSDDEFQNLGFSEADLEFLRKVNPQPETEKRDGCGT